MIYLDNAATTKVRHAVVQKMIKCMENVYANPSGMYTPAKIVKNNIREARLQMSINLGCKTENIYFTSGGSEADNQAILTAMEYGQRNNKKHIISTVIEHHAVLKPLVKAKEYGFEVELIPVNKDGFVQADCIDKAIRKDTCFVSVMYANNEIGTIQPITEIGKICKEKNVLFHTDAVQAAGHIPIDIDANNIDMLSLSAHKFGGPKGIGLLYSRIKPASLILGGKQERGVRAGTENVPGIIGMAEALDIACDNMKFNMEHITQARDYMIHRLRFIEGSHLNGALDNRLPNNINISFEGIDNEALLFLLDKRGIYASASSACNVGLSHVLQAIGVNVPNYIRITLGEDNTADEIQYACDAIEESVVFLRKLQGHGGINDITSK